MTRDARNPSEILLGSLIAADGVAAGMRRLGEQGEALFSVHSLGSTAAILDRQLEAFSSAYRCAAVELRGNGVTGPKLVPADALGVNAAVQPAGSMERFAHERTSKLGLSPQRMWETIAQMACKSVPSEIASTHATWKGDYRAVLRQIKVPRLAAYGERDVIAPRERSAEIAAGIDAAKLLRIANAGHVGNADEPDAFNEMPAEFLDACAR